MQWLGEHLLIYRKSWRKKMFKRLIAGIFALGLSFSVQSKDILIGSFEYGITAENVCNFLEDGDRIVLNSAGGSPDEAIEVVNCMLTKEVQLRVKNAYSAAAFLVLGSKNTCFYPSSKVGFHSPSFRMAGIKVGLSLDQLRLDSSITFLDMRSWGYTVPQIYQVIGMEFMTPYYTIYMIPNQDIIELLGHRYRGECK